MVPPTPGSDDYQAKLRDAQVLAGLTNDQREAVARLVRETAYFSLYWPLVKIRNLPGTTVSLLTTRHQSDASFPETFDLTQTLAPHQLLLGWIDEFGELLDQE